jgi:geranylgeranyl pyrophosphate synthase
MLNLDPELSGTLKRVDDLLMSSVRSDVPTFERVVDHVYKAGGKRIRPVVVLGSYRSAGGREITEVLDMAAALEIIHTGTLIHDDINDDSPVRRGRPSAHVQFGVGDALMTADYLFVKGFGLLSRYNGQVREEIVEACRDMAEGEVVQAHNRSNFNMTEAEYVEIIRKKTARIFSAGARSGGLVADGPSEICESLGDYGLNLGLGFQMMDDILDVVGREDQIGKPPGLDVRQGKLTVPTIHALANAPRAQSRRLMELMARDGKADVSEAIDIIKGAGSIEYAIALCREYGERARAVAEIMPGNDVLMTLAAVAVDRDY